MDINDYLAIQNLVYRYADHLDRGDFDGMAGLFAHADVYVGGAEQPICSDAEAMAAMYREYVRIYPDGTPRTRHVTTNLIVEPDEPGRAWAQSYVTVFQSTPDLPLQPIIGGRNIDRFAKVDGTWRFVERHVDNDMWGDLSQHLLLPFGPDTGAAR